MDIRGGIEPVVRAPEVQQRELLNLHEVDFRLENLARALVSIPEEARLREVRASHSQLMSRRAAVEGDVEEAQIESDHIEADVRVAKERLSADEVRLAASTDAKVSLALQHEIDTLRRRVSHLEDAALNVWQRRDQAERARRDLDEELAQHETLVRDLEGSVREARRKLEDEVATANSLRQAIVAGLPTELVDLYDKQRERYGVGAAALVHGVSMAQGMRLTPADLDAIRRADRDEVVMCPESSCILIRTDESW